MRMLCANCVHKRDEVPDKVEIQILDENGEVIDTIDITEQLKETLNELKKTYPLSIYCEAQKTIAANGYKPTQQVKECEFFEEA